MDYESGRKAETTGCDEELLEYGNREAKFTPGNGMRGVGDYVPGDMHLVAIILAGILPSCRVCSLPAASIDSL